MNSVRYHSSQFPVTRIALYLLALLIIVVITACSHHSSGDASNSQAQKSGGFSLSLLPSSRRPFDALTIQSTHELDDASIDSASISLKRSDNDYPVDIKVEVNAINNTIVIQPQQALWLETAYTLSVTGIRSVSDEQASGVFTAVTSASVDVLPFRTSPTLSKPYTKMIVLADSRVIRTGYFSAPGSDGVWGTDDDVMAQYEERAYQKSALNTGAYGIDLNPGRLASSKFMISAGVDHTWFSADDVAQYAIAYTYDAREIKIKTVYHAGAGADGVWLNEDDELLKYQQRDTVSDTETRETLYQAPGPDGIWFTADDIPTYYNRTETDGHNHWLRYSTFVDPGGDAKWFTADDAPSSYTVDEYNVSDPLMGNHSRHIRFQDAGPDGIWFNVDDTPSNYSVQNSSVEMHFVVYTSPGADGAWFTADDGISSYNIQTDDGSMMKLVSYRDKTGNGVSEDDEVVNYSYRAGNIAGHKIVSATFTAAGKDGLWFTADDVPSNYHVEDIRDDASSLSIEYDSNNLGADQLWLTDDDQPVGYSVFYFNVNSGPYRIVYIGPGPDQIWFSVDDRVTQYRVRENITTASGQEEIDISYADLWDGPGPDGIWKTTDDIPSSYLKTVYVAGFGQEISASDITAGPDGIWFNEDDTPQRYTRYGVTINSVELDSASYSGPGADELWYTTDDKLSSYRITSISTTGDYRYINYAASGPDGVWVTEDDIPESYSQSNVVINDREVASVRFIGPGPDSIWFNTDDEVDYYYATFNDSDGQRRDVTFINAGLDEIWFTDDDMPSYYSRNIKALGNFTDLIIFYRAAGPDSVWFTEDDVISQYNGNMMLADGRSYRSVFYQNSGPDSQWLTEDDVPSQYTQYNYDSFGSYLSSVNYFAPGPDNVWFTDDDLHN